MSNTPKFSKEQYEYLSKLYPELQVKVGMTEQEIFLKAGHQEVLRTVLANIGPIFPRSIRDDRG